MKIYGYTIVDTEGFADGDKSRTYTFETKEKRDEHAYRAYTERLKYLTACNYKIYGTPYGTNDCWEIPGKEEFLKDLETSYPYIRTRKAHYQIEAWETTIRTEKRTTITLRDDEVAMIKYSLECLNKEMNTEGLNTDKQGKATKEYFNLWCDFVRLMETL